jgi:hypothetical protein
VLSGGLRRHQIGHRQALRQIDIARIADGIDFGAVRRSARKQGDGRKRGLAVDLSSARSLRGE